MISILSVAKAYVSSLSVLLSLAPQTEGDLLKKGTILVYSVSSLLDTTLCGHMLLRNLCDEV